MHGANLEFLFPVYPHALVVLFSPTFLSFFLLSWFIPPLITHIPLSFFLSIFNSLSFSYFHPILFLLPALISFLLFSFPNSPPPPPLVKFPADAVDQQGGRGGDAGVGHRARGDPLGPLLACIQRRGVRETERRKGRREGRSEEDEGMTMMM